VISLPIITTHEKKDECLIWWWHSCRVHTWCRLLKKSKSMLLKKAGKGRIGVWNHPVMKEKGQKPVCIQPNTNRKTWQQALYDFFFHHRRSISNPDW
jgi:hypothetical protein